MGKDTLLIRHLPPNLTDEDKSELLKHFGVIQITSLSGREKKSNVVFARFQSEVAASVALRRLHQLDVMGYPLTVEYARKKDSSIDTLPFDNKQTVNITKDEKENSQKYFETFMQKLNSWNAPLNFCQPPPPHLNYLYPPPSHMVLANISRTLASVPKFYTQVLHLMNKMNLPSPFEITHHLQDETQSPSVDVETEHAELVSTEDESEMESEPEHYKPNEIPTKRSIPRTKRIVKKRKFIKPKVLVPSTKTTTKPEQVFDLVGSDTSMQRRGIELRISGETAGQSSKHSSVDEPMQRRGIELRISGETADQSSKHSSVDETGGGFGLMFPPPQPPGEEREDADKAEDLMTGSTITSEQLAANRIPSRDQKHLPVFKNYQPGIPSCRLYIKNLSKQVVERDLHFIYRKYLLPDCEEQGSMFDVRLMKEGRMKGQAFITLQNTKQAQRALIETNGFILKDKPLVVQFARSAKAK